LARIARDHTFLRVLASTGISDGFTNPIKANDLIGAVINHIVIDPGRVDKGKTFLTRPVSCVIGWVDIQSKTVHPVH
jgi:hypothetical protein